MDDLEEVFQYTFKYEDGSYYCWKGDCARSHRCAYLQDATLYNTSDDLKYYAADNKGVVVKVRVTYQEVEDDNGRTNDEVANQDKADEKRYGELVKQEGVTLGGSANTTYMALARVRAEVCAEILRDVENL